MVKKITKLYGYNIRVAAQHWQKSFNRLLKPYDITHAQYMVLHYMSRAQKKDVLEMLSQNQLAYNVSLDAMMVSNILKVLERKGYIARKISENGVSNSLSMTEEGQKLIESLQKKIKKFEKKLFRYVDKPVKKILQSIVVQSLKE